MKSNKVWVLEELSGEYPSITGIYSTEKNADFVKSRVGGDIRECILDLCVKELRDGYLRWVFIMLRDGEVESCDTNPICYSDIGENNRFFIWERTTCEAFRGKGIPDALHCTIWAKSKKHAVKICNDYRIKLIAENGWPISKKGKE
jgi:hypothetical protein